MIMVGVINLKMEKEYDWFGFWVHFVFGAILGFFIGIGLWTRLSFWALIDIYSSISGLICVGGNMVFWGLLAGILRDRLWSR